MLIILSMLICCSKAVKDTKTKKKWLVVYVIAHALCLAVTAPLIPFYGYAAFYAGSSKCYHFCYRPATLTYKGEYGRKHPYLDIDVELPEIEVKGGGLSGSGGMEYYYYSNS